MCVYVSTPKAVNNYLKFSETNSPVFLMPLTIDTLDDNNLSNKAHHDYLPKTQW